MLEFEVPRYFAVAPKLMNHDTSQKKGHTRKEHKNKTTVDSLCQK